MDVSILPAGRDGKSTVSQIATVVEERTHSDSCGDHSPRLIRQVPSLPL